MDWHRSSAFCENGACVEVAFAGDLIVVRDSGEPEMMITFGSDEWQDFITKVKADGFRFA